MLPVWNVLGPCLCPNASLAVYHSVHPFNLHVWVKWAHWELYLAVGCALGLEVTSPGTSWRAGEGSASIQAVGWEEKGLWWPRWDLPLPRALAYGLTSTDPYADGQEGTKSQPPNGVGVSWWGFPE